jgi:hypothetical protein
MPTRALGGTARCANVLPLPGDLRGTCRAARRWVRAEARQRPLHQPLRLARRCRGAPIEGSPARYQDTAGRRPMTEVDIPGSRQPDASTTTGGPASRAARPLPQAPGMKTRPRPVWSQRFGDGGQEVIDRAELQRRIEEIRSLLSELESRSHNLLRTIEGAATTTRQAREGAAVMRVDGASTGPPRIRPGGGPARRCRGCSRSAPLAPCSSLPGSRWGCPWCSRNRSTPVDAVLAQTRPESGAAVIAMPPTARLLFVGFVSPSPLTVGCS